MYPQFDRYRERERAPRPKRGVWLNLYLSIGTAATFYGLVILLPLYMNVTELGENAAPVVLLTLSGVGFAVGLWGMWTWRRWGVWTVAAMTVVSNGVEFVIGTADPADAVQPFVQLVVLWLVVRGRWGAFG